MNYLKNAKPHNPIHLWEEDDQFQKIIHTIPSSLVDIQRCFILYQSALQACNIFGDIAEVGVYKGGTAKLIAKTVEPKLKTLHLFDTFNGMPETDKEKDLHGKGDFNDTSLEQVQYSLKDCSNVKFYAGFFPATSKPVDHLKFSMVHIDVDIYRSVYDCCEYFYPRMEKGGIMIFDDYGFVSCPGAKQAVDEYFSKKSEEKIYLPTGQCMVVKL